MTKEQQALHNVIVAALHYKDEGGGNIEFYEDELTADFPEQDFERAFRWFCERGIIAAHDIGYKSNEHATAAASRSARTPTPTPTHARKHY